MALGAAPWPSCNNTNVVAHHAAGATGRCNARQHPASASHHTTTQQPSQSPSKVSTPSEPSNLSNPSSIYLTIQPSNPDRPLPSCSSPGSSSDIWSLRNPNICNTSLWGELLNPFHWVQPARRHLPIGFLLVIFLQTTCDRRPRPHFFLRHFLSKKIEREGSKENIFTTPWNRPTPLDLHGNTERVLCTEGTDGHQKAKR